MIDLCWVLSKLTDPKGKILIDGIENMVAKLTEEEKQLYEKIDFDMVGLGRRDGSEVDESLIS
jgi:Cys-Gly metallodipeptidase DUG1